VTTLPPATLRRALAGTRAVARPAQAAPFALSPRHPLALLIAAYLFLLPFSQIAPARGVRIRILQLPVLGGRYEDSINLGIVLMPEFLFSVFVLLTALMVTGRWPARRSLSRGAGVLAAVGVTALITSLPATLFAEHIGAALVGWVSLATAIMFAAAVVISRPTEATVRAWLCAFIFGTAVLGMVAIRAYLNAFAIPESLAALPANRLHPFFDDYAAVTYGHSGNTASILTVVASASLALIAAPRQSAWLRALLAVSLVVCFVNLGFAFQRWAWLTISVAGVAVLWRYRASRAGLALLSLLSVAVLLGGSLVTAQLGDYFLDGASFASGGSSVGSRLTAWGIAWDLIRLNPAGYGITLTPTLGLPNVIAHNLLVDAALEGGVLYATALAVWGLYGIAHLTVALFRRNSLSPARFAALLGGVALTSWTLFFGLSISLTGNVIWVTMWFVLPALAIGHAGSEERPTLAAKREG